MRLETKRRTAILLCTVAFAVLAAPAIARTGHRHAHRAVAERAIQAPVLDATHDDRYAVAAQASAGETFSGRRHARGAHAGDAYGGPSSDSLVSEARRYLGTNPTGRGRQWCGAFLDLVLKKTGHAG